MFNLVHEYTLEVNAPIKKTWDYFKNLDNWPKWMPCDSFHCDGELQKGSIIKAKVKNKDKFLSLIIEDSIPYQETKLTMKSFLFYQESFSSFCEIHPDKTRITTRTIIKSPIIPFIKSIILKSFETQFSNMEKSVKEIEE